MPLFICTANCDTFKKNSCKRYVQPGPHFQFSFYSAHVQYWNINKTKTNIDKTGTCWKKKSRAINVAPSGRRKSLQFRGSTRITMAAFGNFLSKKYLKQIWILCILFQKHLLLHQLTHIMTKDCSLNYQFSTRKLQAQNMLCT